MLRLIQFLISGCWHQWEVYKEAPFTYDLTFEEGRCTRYTLQCKKCGNMKMYLGK